MASNSNSTWGAISGGVFLLAIALGIAIFYVTGEAWNALWTVLIVFGAFTAVSSVFRGKGTNNFGASYGDSIMVGGILLTAIGASGLVYSLTGDFIITVIVLIVIIAAIGIVMAIKNRNN